MKTPMTPSADQPQALGKLQAHVLLAGNTLYLDTGKEQDTVLFYDAAGTARYGCGMHRACATPGNGRCWTTAATPRVRVVKIVPGVVPELA